MTCEAEHIIRSELSKLDNIDKGHEIAILCPYHADNNPSCGVAITSSKVPVGTFYCWGCGAHGNWNKLSAKLGLKPIKKHLFQSDFVPDVDTSHLQDNFFGRQLNIGEIEPYVMWRSIDVETQKLVGARYAYNKKFDDKAIILPVHVNGVTRGTITCRWQKEKDQLSYINSPGKWVKTHGLFPFDIYKKSKSVVLVEGPRDALNLIQHGIPSIAILGIKNWTTKKRDLILSKMTKIVLCFDNDEAGKNGVASVKEDFEAAGVTCRVFNYKSDDPNLDPGNMSIKLINRLRKLIFPSKKN